MLEVGLYVDDSLQQQIPLYPNTISPEPSKEKWNYYGISATIATVKFSKKVHNFQRLPKYEVRDMYSKIIY